MLSRLPVWMPAVLLCSLLAWPSAGRAEPRWASMIPFRKVEADPGKSYRLHENNGPWVILAATFVGESAEQQAHALVLELRRDFQLPAYVFARPYDFTQPERGLGFDPYGRPKVMRHMKDNAFVEHAVLVGNYPSFDDPRAQRDLEKIKYYDAKTLDATPESTQRLSAMREIYRLVSPDPEQRKKGPMRMAFITRNPLLPEEFFAPQGLDPLVLEMNQGVEHSLLGCKGRYSVKVATFRGHSTFQIDEMDRLAHSGRTTDKLVAAAEKAHQLTLALRERGVDAYEFHDLHESIVTVGAIDSVGEPRLDGKIELNPAVHRIMQIYGAQPQQADGQTAMVPRMLDGIYFDVQAIPIEVPRPSLSSTFAGGGGVGIFR